MSSHAQSNSQSTVVNVVVIPLGQHIRCAIMLFVHLDMRLNNVNVDTILNTDYC